MKILIIDNYDSFTYNLKQYAKQFCDNVVVKRNDEISLEEIDNYNSIIISPGPGLPKDSGISPKLLKKYSSSKKILGVCLGHQAIAECFDVELINLTQPLHGISIPTFKTEIKDNLFFEIPNEFNTARYHSWAINNSNFVNSDLEILAIDNYNTVQAMRHKKYNVRGVQFHPESILTEYGLKIIENWILRC